MQPSITQWSDKSEPYKKKAASPFHSVNAMVLVGGPSAISFNNFYQIIPKRFSTPEGSILAQL